MTSKSPTVPAEPFGFKSEGFSREIYADVAMKAERQEIRLVQSSYQMTPDVFADEDFEPSNLSNRLGSENVGVAYDSKRGILAGGFIWHAEMKLKRKKVLSLKANYFALYSNLEDCDEKYVGVYFRKVAKFATFPYFRVLFGIQTSASGLALPPLPSLKERVD